MAQHRTKEDKLAAHIHRIENAKLYSLADLSPSSKSAPVSLPKLGKDTHSLGVNMRTVKTDLLRTGIALSIILVLLAAGYHFLH